MNRKIKISKKFKRMCKIYKTFSKDWKHILDYSDECMVEMFLSETYGNIECGQYNGYYVGKKYLNLTVSMWLEDIENGLLDKQELYDDPKFDDWWLDKIFRSKK